MSENVFKNLSLKDFVKPVIVGRQFDENLERFQEKGILSEKEWKDINKALESEKAKKLQEIEFEIKERREFLEQELANTRESMLKQIEDSVAGSRKYAEEKVKEADEIAAKKIDEARAQAEAILKEANFQVEKLNKENYEKIAEKAFKECSNQWIGESKLLIDSISKVLIACADERKKMVNRFIDSITNLVFLIVRKVIKIIAYENEQVVRENIMEAVKLVKDSNKMVINVNTKDLAVSVKMKQELLNLLSTIENIEVLEDPNIEPGGCYIETNFGSVDARISSQLFALEDHVRKVDLIKRSTVN